MYDWQKTKTRTPKWFENQQIQYMITKETMNDSMFFSFYPAPNLIFLSFVKLFLSISHQTMMNDIKTSSSFIFLSQFSLEAWRPKVLLWNSHNNKETPMDSLNTTLAVTRPHLDYCTWFWICFYGKSIDPLDLFQGITSEMIYEEGLEELFIAWPNND